MPTSGLATLGPFCEAQGPLRDRLIDAHRRALGAIVRNHPAALAIQRRQLPAIKPRFAEWMRSLFVVDGLPDRNSFEVALQKLAREMGVEHDISLCANILPSSH